MEEQKIKDLMTEVYNFAEVKTLLTVLIQDFKDHKIDDDKSFNNLYALIRALPDNTRKELEIAMKERYVTKTEFEVFVAEVKGLRWLFVGATVVTSTITWGLMVWVYISKLP
jgi:monomeric isocitrate dehydrogenase